MHSSWKNPWLWFLFAWIGLIFFSSTSLALQISENAFRALSDVLLPHWPRASSSFGAMHLVADKGVHVTLFAVLGMLLVKLLPDSRRKIATAILIGAVIGTCSEILQSFFPDRDPAVRDVLINTSGTALGVVVSMGFRNLFANRVGSLPEKEHQKVA